MVPACSGHWTSTVVIVTAAVLQVYTIDNFYKSLTVVGYATLNVFVETGTERQPVVDKPMQVCQHCE